MAQAPRAVVVALAIQILVLPPVAFALVFLFDFDPLFAVGVMLVAASPGGTTAILFRLLFHDDKALNVSLPTVNSVIAALTIPLTNAAIAHFDVGGELGLQFGKVAQVIALVLVPVAVGMVVRSWRAAFSTAVDRPVRIFSIIVLVVVSVGAILGERKNVGDYFAQVGPVVIRFCACSLALGYVGSRLLRLGRPQAIVASMEVGIHNTTVALSIALSVLDSAEVAIPAAVYSIFMYSLAAGFGHLLTRGSDSTRTDEPAAAA